MENFIKNPFHKKASCPFGRLFLFDGNNPSNNTVALMGSDYLCRN